MNQQTIKPVKGFGVFSAVWQAGKKIKKYPVLTSVVYDLQSVELTPYRFEIMSEPNAIFVGVSISKRRAKKAVVRNRIKRLLREAARLTIKEMEDLEIGINFKVICISAMKAPQSPKEVSLKDLLPAVRKAMFAATENEEKA